MYICGQMSTMFPWSFAREPAPCSSHRPNSQLLLRAAPATMGNWACSVTAYRTVIVQPNQVLLLIHRTAVSPHGNAAFAGICHARTAQRTALLHVRCGTHQAEQYSTGAQDRVCTLQGVLPDPFYCRAHK